MLRDYSASVAIPGKYIETRRPRSRQWYRNNGRHRDLTGQTLLDYVEERVERCEGLVLWIGHDWFPNCRAPRRMGILARRPLVEPDAPAT